MRLSTPFFPQFVPLTGGRAARPAALKIAQAWRQFKHASLSQLESLFEAIVPASLFSLAQSGANSRERIFTPRVTFWAFLFQALRQGSCRSAVRAVQARLHLRRGREMSSDDAAYCKARERLPTSLLKRLHEHAAAHLQGQCRQEHLWKGRSVKVVDATGCSMPDTPGNQAIYPQPGGQKPGCGFPVAQLVGLFCLASGALLEFAKTELKVHELAVFLCELLNHLLPGDIVLGDRAYCAYVSIGLLLERSVDCVFRLHQARPVDFRRGRYVAKDDRLITWHKPKKCPPYLTEEEFAGLPQTLRLRQVRFYVSEAGFRTQKVVLITTLLDHKAFPAADLAALYARRWEIELSFRDIKISLGMDVLRCKSPAMVEKEIYIHLIGYNLIRTIMLEASESFHVPLSRMSFKGSLDTIVEWAQTIDAVRDKARRKAAAIDQMLKAIATDPVPERLHRAEPRVKKRRSKNYQWMTKPRAIMRVSASRKRK